jgi:hypothetical protein
METLNAFRLEVLDRKELNVFRLSKLTFSLELLLDVVFLYFWSIHLLSFFSMSYCVLYVYMRIKFILLL